ncbi:unnamed protein product [Microthlaspi erraticum]|uniref:Uncharacterized protein n=1 Tax=Microthlaspi erraticum TaxID=1685480 RepID=A0A6D2IGK9_9BRAS|nr:unnamed protein product [Microthlaspi erraticum]
MGTQIRRDQENEDPETSIQQTSEEVIGDETRILSSRPRLLIVRSMLDLTEEKNKHSNCEDSYNIYDRKDDTKTTMDGVKLLIMMLTSLSNTPVSVFKNKTGLGLFVWF